MNRELTDEEKLVWDRLQNGIKSPPTYSYLEEEMVKFQAEEFRKAILKDLIKVYET